MRPCDGERGGAGIEGTPREGSVPGKPRARTAFWREEINLMKKWKRDFRASAPK
jgi:hypothetical protein